MDSGSNSEDIEILREKLRTKSESLTVLSKQLQTATKERDEYKCLVDNLYDKNLYLKKRLFKLNELKRKSSLDTNNLDDDIESNETVQVLRHLNENLKQEKCKLEFKSDELKHELDYCKINLKLLREKLHDSMRDVKSSSLDSNRTNLIKEIEAMREQNELSESDFKLLQCQREELELEVKSYRSRLKDLNELLATSHRDLKIDELISQNKYLNESNANLRRELDLVKEKYQKLKDSLKSKQFLSEEKLYNINIVNKNQLKEVLKIVNHFLNANSHANSDSNGIISLPNLKLYKLLEDLNSVCNVLVDNLNDKNTALMHQKRVNKMLADRIHDLEKQLNKLIGDESSGNEESPINLEEDLLNKIDLR